MALEAEPYTKLQEDLPSGSNCLKSGRGMNWKRSEKVNRDLRTDSAYNSHSLYNISYLDNLVEEVKHGLF